MHNMLNVINHRKPSPVLRLWDAFTIPLLFARYAQSLTLTWIKPHSHIVSLKTEKSEFVQIPWVIIFCPFFSATFGAKNPPFSVFQSPRWIPSFHRRLQVISGLHQTLCKLQGILRRKNWTSQPQLAMTTGYNSHWKTTHGSSLLISKKWESVDLVW